MGNMIKPRQPNNIAIKSKYEGVGTLKSTCTACRQRLWG